MPQAVPLGVFFITGIVGSLGHCLGMCVPFVALVSRQTQVRGLPAVPYYLLYHAARISVYMLLGVLAVEVGTFGGLATQLPFASAAISILLGVGIIALAFGTFGLLAGIEPAIPEKWMSSAVGKAMRYRTTASLLLMGGLNGLLPCGLVYTALLMAATKAQPRDGALGMLVFGLGTLPLLLAAAIGINLVSLTVRQRVFRFSSILMALVGVQLIFRGLAGMELVPHLMLGRLMLW